MPPPSVHVKGVGKVFAIVDGFIAPQDTWKPGAVQIPPGSQLFKHSVTQLRVAISRTACEDEPENIVLVDNRCSRQPVIISYSSAAQRWELTTHAKSTCVNRASPAPGASARAVAR